MCYNTVGVDDLIWHCNIHTAPLIYIQPKDGFLKAETCF